MRVVTTDVRRCVWTLWLLAAALCLVGPVVPSAAAAPKNVFILSEGPGLPNAVVVRERIAAALRQDGDEPVNIHEELIDTIQFRNLDYDRQLAALYKAKYAGETFDLVIALSEPALDFALRHRGELFPDAPLLFGGVDERVVRGRDLGPNTTGLLLRVGALATVEAALALHPRTRNILLVGGMSRLDRKWLEAIEDDMRTVAAKVRVTYMTEHTLSEVLAAVSALGDGALVLLVSLSADADGVARSGPEFVEAIRQAATVPIYGMSDNYLGRGIVGGVLIDLLRHGTELGQRGRQILAGLGRRTSP